MAKLQHKTWNDITCVMTWYGQEDHLYSQCEFYNYMAMRHGYTPRVIFINDGHEEGRDFFHSCIQAHKSRFNVMGIDVTRDMGFNSHVCRNIGAKHVKTDWMMLIDVDCFESTGMYEYLRFEKTLDPNMFYVPKVDMEAPEVMSGYELLCPKGIIKYKTHPNTWIMTREAFWATGGYDIEFQGVRHGDAEFFLGIERPGVKKWDYDLLSDDDDHRMVVKIPRRDPFYIRQDGKKQNEASQIVNYIRLRNMNPYKKYRKTLWNVEWEYV